MQDLFGGKMTGSFNDLLRTRRAHLLLYSDTLVYWREVADGGGEEEALVDAVVVAIRVICSGLAAGFMLRGAISFGELLTCESPEALAGPVVNECAEHYELGDWCGCHLAPSAAKLVDGHAATRDDKLLERVAKIRVPLKSKAFGDCDVRWAVSWLDYQSNESPKYVKSQKDRDLKKRIEGAGSNIDAQKRAVKEHFVELLNEYARSNPIAKTKVDLTIRAIAPEFSTHNRACGTSSFLHMLKGVIARYFRAGCAGALRVIGGRFAR
jgi:hypothetical protein